MAVNEWKDIRTCPKDTIVLLKKEFDEVETPCVVIGEITSFNGEVHHLWRGAYTGVVDLYKNEIAPYWDEKFTHWKEL